MNNKVNYLRISVTDRCNLNCVYCNPLGDCDFIERSEILTFKEMRRLTRLFAKCGITKVRLTGGEPLVRKGIVNLVEKIAGIEEIQELALTTNGILLESMAQDLKNAGLSRVNVSIDTADRESYKKITGADMLDKVTAGIHKAVHVGLQPIKLNSVIIKGVNDDPENILTLAKMSVNTPITVRFIEYCPTNGRTKPSSDYFANRQIANIIENRFGKLVPVLKTKKDGPATYFKLSKAAGDIGFISGRSSVFCQSCNRIRLTSDGKIRPCLYSNHAYNVKKLIRNDDASDEQLLEYIKKILSEKGNVNKLNSISKNFSMRKIGG